MTEDASEIWSIADVKNLHVSWPDSYGGRSLVSEVLSTFQQHILDNYQKYELLIVSMKEHGQAVPIKIMPDRQTLRDGIHRIAIADSMGWADMQVTVGGKSTWIEWDASATGKEYWKGLLA